MPLRFFFIAVLLCKISPGAAAQETIPIESSREPLCVTDTTRYRLIEKAKALIGVQYKYGSSDENGFDCSGYVKYIYNIIGYTLPHSSLAQFASSRPVGFTEALPGDLVFFKTRGKQISHVGIYLGDNLFIHAPSRGKSVSIDSLEGIYYKKHLAGFGSVL